MIVIALSICSVASDAQVELARVYIERTVMGHIYTHAMYPNGDGDIMRDKYVELKPFFNF